MVPSTGCGCRPVRPFERQERLRKSRPRGASSTTPASDHGARGQTLVEFALVFPLFFTLIIGFIEFAFMFNAVLSVTFATRDAALLAVEVGSTTGTDCVVLKTIEDDVSAPADHAQISAVDIYRAKSNGDPYGGGTTTTWSRTGSTTCTMTDLTTVTVPYTRTINGYPEASRCNVLAGCGTGHPSVDYVGVTVHYSYRYVTPIKTFITTGTTLDFERSNVMRMEPIL